MEDITQPAIQRSKRACAAKHKEEITALRRKHKRKRYAENLKKERVASVYICVLVSDLAHNCYLVLYFNPHQVAAFYQTLQGLED
jgi:7-keto-8-aminopelargonate synthetase-like enzyme